MATNATASSVAARHRRHAAEACRAICAAVIRAAVIRAAASAPLLSVASLSSPPSFAASASARVASNHSRLADWLSHNFPRVMSQSIWPYRRPRGSTGRCRRSPKTCEWLLRHHERPFASRGHINRANWRQRILLRRATEMCSGPHHQYCLRKIGESYRHDGARRPSMVILKGLLKAHLFVMVWGATEESGDSKHTLKVKKE